MLSCSAQISIKSYALINKHLRIQTTINTVHINLKHKDKRMQNTNKFGQNKIPLYFVTNIDNIYKQIN